VFVFPDKSGLHRRTIRKNLEAADIVCSTGHVIARRTRQLCGDIRASEVTPFGVDLARFSAVPGRPRGNTLTVGTVKTLERNYGIDLLLRAFAHARSTIALGDAALAKSMRLLIVGGGRERRSLEELAGKCGISDVSDFVGPVPHDVVPTYLHKLDIYCALSRSESFGVAVLEASACGLPVVVSDVGGLPEVVVDGATGLVVERENLAAAAEAITRLALTPAMRTLMGQAGRTHVRENYDWNDSVTIMENVYEKAARRVKSAA